MLGGWEGFCRPEGHFGAIRSIVVPVIEGYRFWGHKRFSLQVGGSKLGKEEHWEPKYVGVQCKGGRDYAGPALPPPPSWPSGMLGGPGDRARQPRCLRWHRSS